MTTVKEWPCETARLSLATLLLASMTGCATAGGTADVAGYDLVIRNGSIYDGSGSEPYVGCLLYTSPSPRDS